MTNWFDLVQTLAWIGTVVLGLWFFRTELKALLSRLRSVGPSGAEFAQQMAPAGDPTSTEPLTVADRPMEVLPPGQPRQPRDPRDLVAPVYRALVQERMELSRRGLALAESVFDAPKEEVLLAGTAEFNATLHLERASRWIFRSQVDALDVLAQHPGPLTKDAFHPFYARAAQAFPEAYATYSFNQWFAFLLGQELVVEQGGTVAITKVGKVIGHYMAERSYTTHLTF